MEAKGGELRSQQRLDDRTPPRRLRMATCEVCENEYDKAFEVIVAGKASHLR